MSILGISSVTPPPVPPPPVVPPHSEQGDLSVPPHGEQGDVRNLLRHSEQGDVVVATAMRRLATGLRINRGADDPAGLIASENLRAALKVLDAETRAMERMDAVASVADGALAEVSELLIDANAASVAMANSAGLSDAERGAYQMEIDSARQSIDRITNATTFNGKKILDGSMTLSYGDASVAVDRIAVEGSSESLRDAMGQVAALRGEIGAFQKNALGAQSRSAAATYQNVAAAESVIRDTDYAVEISNLMRASVLAASGRAVAALANSSGGILA